MYFYLIDEFVYLQKELPNKANCPHMCAYKLVTVEFKWFGLQGTVEKKIQDVWHIFFFATRRKYNFWLHFGGKYMNICIDVY